MLLELWRAWIAVATKPELATFEAEKPKATLEKAVVALLISGVISGILTGLQVLLGWSVMLGALQMTDDPETARLLDLIPWLENLWPTIAVAAVVLSPVMNVMFSLFMSAVFLLFARLFGGRSSYTVQTHLMALIYAPYTIISGLLGLIPCLGGLGQLAIFIYTFYLLTLALQAAHDVTAGKAVAIWLGPIAVLVVLFICGIVALVLTLASLVGQPSG